MSREDLIINGNETLSERDIEKYSLLLEKRRNGECIAYILGRKEFRGLEFTVNPTVLVPRPDTEILVEAALEHIDKLAEEKSRALAVLDLCTGSGALAISLKNERPFLSVSASDISVEALETASLNASRLLDSAVLFIQSNAYENISEKFNIILSNPPYIPQDKLDSLAPEVRREPRLALDGGKDGLALIREIVSLSPGKLMDGGILLLEASPEQIPLIQSLLEKRGFSGIKINRDLAGRKRVISAIFN